MATMSEKVARNRKNIDEARSMGEPWDTDLGLVLDNVREAVKTDVWRLAKSGGIDTSADCALKVLVHIALDHVAYQYQPLSDEARKMAKNLRHF